MSYALRCYHGFPSGVVGARLVFTHWTTAEQLHLG